MDRVPLCIGGPETSNRDIGGSSNSHSGCTAEYFWMMYPVVGVVEYKRVRCRIKSTLYVK